MFYAYKTKFGVFRIISPTQGRHWLLLLGDEILNSYPSPQQAADEVYQCSTGFTLWDQQGKSSAPASLAEWKVGK